MPAVFCKPFDIPFYLGMHKAGLQPGFSGVSKHQGTAANSMSSEKQSPQHKAGVDPRTRIAISASIPLEERKLLGRHAKGLIDQGRLHWLREQGFKVITPRVTGVCVWLTPEWQAALQP